MKFCFSIAIFLAWATFFVILLHLELPVWVYYVAYFAGLGAFVFAEHGVEALEDKLNEKCK